MKIVINCAGEDEAKHIEDVCGRVTSDIKEKIIIKKLKHEQQRSAKADIMIIESDLLKDKKSMAFYGCLEGTKTIVLANRGEILQGTYSMDVVGFVEKQKVDLDLPNLLKNIVKKLNDSQSLLKQIKIHCEDIKYIRSEHIYSFIHMKNNEEKMVRISGKKIEAELANIYFVRVNRAYIVNLKFVDKYEHNKMEIDNLEIDLSSSHCYEVEKRYRLLRKGNM